MTGLAVAGTSIWLAWRGPAFSIAGTSPYATVAELAAGWALIVSGIAARRRRPASRFGLILAVAGVAWFLVEWPNPASAGSALFSVGLVFHVAYPALIAHAVLGFPTGRLGAPIARVVVAAAYLTNIVVLGVLPTLFFEPGSAGCPGCPDNAFALGSDVGLVTSFTRLGLLLEVAWIAAAIGLLIARLMRVTAASRRLSAPVLVPGIAFLVCVAIDAMHAFQRGYLSNDALDLTFWYGQAAALVAMAAGVELEAIRARRARQQVTQIVLDLAGSTPPRPIARSARLDARRSGPAIGIRGERRAPGRCPMGAWSSWSPRRAERTHGWNVAPSSSPGSRIAPSSSTIPNDFASPSRLPAW